MKEIYLTTLFIFALSGVCAQSFSASVSSGNYQYTLNKVEQFNERSGEWYDAGWTFDANECEFNARAASFSDGKLSLQILQKQSGDMGKYNNKPYWGAEYGSNDEYQYGMFFVRMKPTTPSGVVTSFFLNHIDWNADYTIAHEWHEIDIEFAGRTDQVQFTLHWIDETGKHMDAHTVPLPFDAAKDFHEWAVEWTPTYIKYYVDGQWLFTFDDPALIKEQMRAQHIQMNQWVSNAPGWVGPFDPAVLPIATQYDYVAYYTLNTDANAWQGITATLNDSIIQLKGLRDLDVFYVLRNAKGEILQKGTTNKYEIILKEKLNPGMYEIQMIDSRNKTVYVKVIK